MRKENPNLTLINVTVSTILSHMNGHFWTFFPESTFSEGLWRKNAKIPFSDKINPPKVSESPRRAAGS